MWARTDLWEPGASNRLGPPGQADFFANEKNCCLATISFPCGRQLEVPVDGAPLEYLSSIFAQRQLEFPGTGRLLIIVTPDFHGGCDGRGWTRQGTSAVAAHFARVCFLRGFETRMSL